jgi:hypothetical protein
MVGVDPAFQDPERPQVNLLGFTDLAPATRIHRQVVQRDRESRMLRAEHSLLRSESGSIGRRRVVQVGERRPEVVPRARDLGVVRPQGLLQDGDRVTKQRLGLIVAAQCMEYRRPRSLVLGGRDVLGTEQAPPELYRLPGVRLRRLEVATGVLETAEVVVDGCDIGL